MDKNEKSSESEYETDEEWEDERNKQRALMEKDKVSRLKQIRN